uniref:Uncharacterized protein n=1 Tax=Helianthus annuus TaxID=4232 RepID=A0A251UMA6_HELAN
MYMYIIIYTFGCISGSQQLGTCFTVKTAISKFRAAIRLQFDFHRAIYNLGTVLYGLAEDTSRTGVLVIGNEISSNELYSQSAIYVAAAHALKPNYLVYTSALKLVRSMLPLPYLKVGYLTVPPVENPVAPHCDWKRFKFVLNHEGLQQIHDDEEKTNDRPAICHDPPKYRIFFREFRKIPEH